MTDKLLVSRDDVRLAYEFLGLDPSLWEGTARVEIGPELVRATRYRHDEAGQSMIGEDGELLYEVMEVAIEDFVDLKPNQAS